VKRFFIRMWAAIINFFKKAKTKMQETPYKPPPISEERLRALREVQASISAGVSYRAIARATGLSKAEVKSLKILNTGRFYFAPSDNLDINQRLIPEKWDPITQQTSSPISTPIFTSALEAWAWLAYQRQNNTPTNYTPTSH